LKVRKVSKQKEGHFECALISCLDFSFNQQNQLEGRDNKMSLFLISLGRKKSKPLHDSYLIEKINILAILLVIQMTII